MNRYLPILLLILATSEVYCQLPSFDSERTRWLSSIQIDTIITDVTNIQYQYFAVKDDSIFLIDSFSIQDHFYDSGKISKIYFRDQTDELLLSLMYDPSGRISEQRKFAQIFSWGSLIIYEYDLAELKSSELIRGTDSLSDLRSVITYNKSFKPLRAEEFGHGSYLKQYWAYQYDSLGQLIKDMYINIDGRKIRAFGRPYTLFENDTTIYHIEYNAENSHKKITEYSNSILKSRSESFKKRDTLILKLDRYKDGEVNPFMTRITRSSDSLKIVFRLFHVLETQHKRVFVNNQQIQYELRYDDVIETNDFTYKYEFDDRNNWVEERAFRNGDLIKITKRDISYETPANKR